MSDKMKNFIVRTITGVLFVIIMVSGIAFRAEAMILLFALITGLTIWEYTGLVNEIENVSVNRSISTTAGVYLFLAFAGYCADITPPVIFIPYLLTLVYLFISELYTKNPNPIHDWAYTMLGQMYIALPLSMFNVLAFRYSQTDGFIHYNGLLALTSSSFFGATIPVPIAAVHYSENISFSHVSHRERHGKAASEEPLSSLSWLQSSAGTTRASLSLNGLVWDLSSSSSGHGVTL